MRRRNLVGKLGKQILMITDVGHENKGTGVFQVLSGSSSFSRRRRNYGVTRLSEDLKQRAVFTLEIKA